MLQLITILALQFFMSAPNPGNLAQEKQRTIQGKIISFEESFPIKDATVTLKDGKPLTKTQANGSFTINVAADEKIILVSHQEYELKEVPLTKATTYSITLRRKTSLN